MSNTNESTTTVVTAESVISLHSLPASETTRDEIIQRFERMLPSNGEIGNPIDIQNNDLGQVTASVPISLKFNFPNDFTDKKMRGLIRSSSQEQDLLTIDPDFKTNVSTPNGYDNSIANQYTFSIVSTVGEEEEPCFTDIHSTANTYAEACDLLLKALDGDDIDVSSTTFSFKPTESEINEYKNWTFTKFDSAKHQAEIIILPDSGHVISEDGFIYEPTDLELKNGKPISNLTMSYQENFSDLDNSIIRVRLRESIRGIVMAFLSRPDNKELHTKLQTEFNDILKLPSDTIGYTSKDFYTWVYNNELTDTEKLSSYYEWCDQPHEKQARSKLIPNSKPTPKQ
jgi:hypothetical protein